MTFWPVLTRLGEAEILLPVTVLTAALLFRNSATRHLAWLWMALLGAAATLTTVSKLAFIGWGLGSAAIDFTGVSGHAMFSSSIYPLLLRAYLGGTTPLRQRAALVLGALLAVVVGASRIAIGVHSLSEVLAGWMLGAVVTGVVLRWAQGAQLRVRALLPMVLLAWVAIMPVQMQASQTHSLVTAVALRLSGRSLPFERADLLRGAAAQDRQP